METGVTPDILGIARSVVKYCAEYAKAYVEQQKAALPEVDKNFEFKVKVDREDLFELTINKKGYNDPSTMLRATLLNISGELLKTTDIIQVNLDSRAFGTIMIRNLSEETLDIIGNDGGQISYNIRTSFRDTLYKEYSYDIFK